jgi:hypothetical protein
VTALALPTPRHIPWRRMAWITWRQHRLTLAGVGALLGAAAVYVLITGLRMHQAYAAVSACRPASSDVCQRVANDFANAYSPAAGVTAGLLQLVPALIGAFAGAPLLAREFETGTFRYAWTQGFGRARWTVAKLVLLAFAVTLAAAAFSVLFSWSYQPVIGADRHDRSPLNPAVFDLCGVAFAAWTLAAFAIGALAGILIRKVLPAIFATVAACAALTLSVALYLRGHYEAPLVTTNPGAGAPDWVLSQVWTQGGRPASLSMINRALRPVGVQAVTPEQFQAGPGPTAAPDNVDPVQYLAHHGFTYVTTYQPAGRFWPFQWIEGGWLLALSLLLLAATVWLVRRRAT